jgi:hypothetical protein
VAYPSVHAPWFAYLAWTTFAHGDYKQLADTTFVGAKVDNKQFCKANIKVNCRHGSACIEYSIHLLTSGSTMIQWEHANVGFGHACSASHLQYLLETVRSCNVLRYQCACCTNST